MADRNNNEDADEDKAYRWETFKRFHSFILTERSWDQLQEDENGEIKLENFITKRRRVLSSGPPIQRGIIRHVILLIDMSASMALLDLKPNRGDCTIGLVVSFIHEFFDQNPLSLLGIIMTRDGQAEMISPLSSSPTSHISALRDPSIREPRGEASLQNGLELARLSLR
jgi:transcription initiation factor TFIIH subunit 2